MGSSLTEPVNLIIIISYRKPCMCVIEYYLLTVHMIDIIVKCYDNLTKQLYQYAVTLWCDLLQIKNWKKKQKTLACVVGILKDYLLYEYQHLHYDFILHVTLWLITVFLETPPYCNSPVVHEVAMKCLSACHST